jgi:hypothetical protein
MHVSRHASLAPTFCEPILPCLLHLLWGLPATQSHVLVPLNNHRGSSPEVTSSNIVGEEEGPALGEADGFLDEVGEIDGLTLGDRLGCSDMEGLAEGDFDGLEVGDSDGLSAGAEDGMAEGLAEGEWDGL